MKNYCCLIVAALLLNSCVGPCWDSPKASYSNVTFVKNTLDYSILVQCYFRPFNNNDLWCSNELIKYSEPIEINPNESKIVIDYIKPSGIKIFKSHDSTLLFEKMDLGGYIGDVGSVLQYSPTDAKQLGTFDVKQIVPAEWLTVLEPYHYGYIKDDRYLYGNVPWSLYPIFLDNYYCYEGLIKDYDKERKNLYMEIINGYAAVSCIVLDKNAKCFVPAIAGL